MTILRSGSNQKYADNWAAAFGSKKTAKRKTTKAKQPAKATKRSKPKKSK